MGVLGYGVWYVEGGIANGVWFVERWGGEYLPLLSNARFSAFERLGECRDGVESGGGEGGVGEEGAGGCHVVFAPLEVAAWFFGERVVLGYGFTCRPICNKGILRDGNTE